MWLLFALLIVLPFGLAVIVGAPYVPILRRDYEPLLKLTKLKAGQTLVDLGSGDGRLLRAAAKQGIRGIGYEINPFLYLVSLVVTWRYRQLVTIHLADFWRIHLPEADAVYVFLIDRLMPKLDAKLSREIAKPTPVVSFVFQVPGRKPTTKTRNAYLYTYGQLAPSAKRDYHKQ